MFKLNIQHSNNIKGSVLPFRNQASIIRPHQGYHNIDSPMKAAFRLESSPRKSLSPIKLNTQSRLTPNRSRSPILLSKRDDQSAKNGRLSPFRRAEFRQPQEDYGPHKHISFTNLIKRNSNAVQYENQQNQSHFNRTMEHSSSNYLQSDRNFRQDTNLFKKLASMLESNKSGKSSFLSSGISDNSMKYKGMPQTCKNQNSSNKKVFIKNVMTVQSIQSPEEKELGYDYEEHADIQTKCYSDYEKMTSQCPNLARKSSNTSRQQDFEPRMQKKESKRVSYQVQEDQVLSFKKISFVNQKIQDQSQVQKNAIDYHLTNSFGTTANLKNQIMGSQGPAKKPLINPFEHIMTEPQQETESIESIKRSVLQSQDSMFASLKMLLSKMDQKLPQSLMQKENESINISIMSENEQSELDMEPYLQKRR